MNKSLSIAMLGWKAPLTTRRTLESWARVDLPSCGDELFLFFNQISAADLALADEFGMACRGSETNLGITGGREAIVASAKGDYILFLDADHDVIVSREETRRWIDSALELLKANRADVVIMLNRFERLAAWEESWFFKYHFIRELDPRAEKCVALCPPDWNRDTLYRKLHRFFRPGAARRRINGAAPYLERYPEKIWPDYITREGDFILLDSAVQPFCDSPVMMSRDFYLKVNAWGKKHPGHRTIMGFQELEYVLNCPWWRRQHFRTAVCDGGVFGHHRLDDSWRARNPTYNAALVPEKWRTRQ